MIGPGKFDIGDDLEAIASCLFAVLSPEAYEKVQAPKPEEIEQALKKGCDDMNKVRRGLRRKKT